MKSVLKTHIGGQEWEVFVVSKRSRYLDRGKFEARCRFDLCRIFLSKDLTPSSLEDALLHELEHVLLRVSGVWEILDNALGTAEAGRVDEAIVSTVTPLRHRLLRDLGFRFSL